jgi:hypothetical protein
MSSAFEHSAMDACDDDRCKDRYVMASTFCCSLARITHPHRKGQAA